MNPARLFGLLLLSCSIVGAQVQFHFGVTGGVPLTDTLSSSSSSSASGNPPNSSFDRYHSVTKRLLVGPVLRVDLPRGLGLEFDALYQRVNYDHASSTSQPSYFYQSFEQGTGNLWQFPLLVQYHWTLSGARLFVEAGPSISRIANGRSTISSITVNGPSSSSSASTAQGLGGTLAGITVGGGIDIPVFGHHLRPEVRYSHWFSPTGTGGVTGSFLSTNYTVTGLALL